MSTLSLPVGNTQPTSADLSQAAPAARVPRIHLVQQPGASEAGRPARLCATAVDSDKQPTLEAAHRASMGQDQSLRILVMDGNSSERQAMVKYLEKRDMHVLPAGDWHQAKHQLLSGDLQLAVLDLRPGDDGCLDLIRQVRSRSEIPLIVTASPHL